MDELQATVILILGLLALGMLRRELRNRKRLRLHEMAHRERGDVCAVPAATVVAESMVGIVLADAFLEKLRLGLEEKQGYIFDTQDYQGITVYASPEYDLAFARSKGLVLFSNQVEGIQTAIDTQQGESLAKNADYQRLIKQLPGKRAVTFYVGGEQYMQLLSQMGGSGLTGGASLMGSNQLSAAAKGFAGSLAITDDGLRMDVLALHDPEKMTEAYRTYLANASQTARVAEVLPAETMLMFAGYGLNDYMRLVEESMSEEIAADYADSMQMLEQELGFSLKADLLAYLDQEYGMAVLPDKEGILSTLTSLPLNLLLFTHHNNQDMLAVTMEKLSVKVEEMGLTVTPSDEGENHYYIAGDPYSGDILTAGLGKAYLALSLSRTAVDSVLNPIETLAGKAEYQEVWSHFPKGITPNLYFEFANLVFDRKEDLPELASDSSNDVWSVLEAIPHIVSGSLPVKDDTAHSITIIFVESLPEE